MADRRPVLVGHVGGCHGAGPCAARHCRTPGRSRACSTDAVPAGRAVALNPARSLSQVAHSWWRTAALEVLTPAAYEVFRRSPARVRRLVIRVLTPNYTVGAVAVCEDQQGRVLLVRSRQHGGWGLPGGLVRRGEGPIEGLARELFEELSIAVSPADLVAGLTRTLVDPATQQVTVVVAVTLHERPVVDGAEVVEARWFAQPDLPTGLVRGTSESLASVGAAHPPHAAT